MIAKLPKYPRYQPNAMRPPGAGAFFDFALGVANRDVGKLKSCSLRRWGRAGAPSTHAATAEEQEAAPLIVIARETTEY